MATHSSVLAWRTPGMGEPGGLPSVGSIESDTTEATQQQQQQRQQIGPNLIYSPGHQCVKQQEKQFKHGTNKGTAFCLHT